MSGSWQRWLVIGALPAVAFVVGAIALPRPSPEGAAVDRSSLGTSVSRTRPAPKVPADITLGDDIRVVGADVPEAALSRGSTFALRVYFQALEAMERDWMVFVHIDARQGSYRIHGDHVPVRGKYPTTLWQVGEYITDDWTGTVPRDAAPGVYDVWIGFYIGDDRLPFTDGPSALHDGNNRIRVGTLTVE